MRGYSYRMQGRFMQRPLLGRGIAFPFSFSSLTRGTVIGVASSEDEERINQSIWQILSTRCAIGDVPGEDDSLPDYGSKLASLLFQPIGPVLRAAITAYVIDALERWEKRIAIGAVSFLSGDLERIEGMGVNQHVLPGSDIIADLAAMDRNIERVKIDYTIISTQAPGNRVYPFALDGDMRIMNYGYDAYSGVTVT